MPKAEIEIQRTVETTRDESVVVYVNVPAEALGDPDELYDWVNVQLAREDSELSKAVHETGWDLEDEDETIDLQAAHHLI